MPELDPPKKSTLRKPDSMANKRSELGSRGRILVLASYSPMLINFRSEMLEAFIKLGYEVHTAAPNMSAETSEKLSSLGCIPHEISLSRQGVNPAKDLMFLFRIYLLIRRIRPSVFFGYSIKPVIYGNLASWAARVPKRCTLITGLGFSFSEEGTSGRVGLIKKIAKLLYRAALKKTHYILFQNNDDLDLFRRIGFVENQKTGVVAGSGVDLVHFAPTCLPQGPRYLIIARLLVEKGIREFVEASQIVKQKIPGSRFMILGQLESGPSAISQNELEQWIESKGIEYLGTMSDVRPAITDASVYVLPSYREGTPRSVLEAMAMSRPIITCNTPGCRETVQEGVNGFMVPMKSVQPLADAMIRLGTDLDLRVSMGNAGRQLVVKRFDVHKVNKAIVQILELD